MSVPERLECGCTLGYLCFEAATLMTEFHHLHRAGQFARAAALERQYGEHRKGLFATPSVPRIRREWPAPQERLL